VGVARPVVLSGLTRDELRFVSSLEGGREVSAEAAKEFAGVARKLTAARAWEPSSLDRSTHLSDAARTVALHGCGRLGMTIAEALTLSGLAVALSDDALAAAEPPRTFAAPMHATCAGAASHTLALRGVDTRIGDAAALAVVVCAGAPDPAVAERLVRDDVPHVLVVTDETGVLVSHVVVPGQTPCSRCRDLALTRSDPAWPYLALQLAGSPLPTRRPSAHPLVAFGAAVRVTVRLLRWLDTGDAGVAERLVPLGAMVNQPFLPQADCGCGAAAIVGDELAAKRARFRPD